MTLFPLEIKSLSVVTLGLAAGWQSAPVRASGDGEPVNSISNESDVRMLLDEVAALRDEVRDLRASGRTVSAPAAETWLTGAQAEEVRALAQEAVQDAQSRASLLSGGESAGWDQGFYLQSADGNFKLVIGGYLQFRYMFSEQDDSPVDNGRGGFENTRTRLTFSGHIGDPTWIYYIQGDHNRDGGTFGLQDAYIGHVFGDSGWTALAGQFPVPMLREELVADTAQQLVGRSLVWSEFTAGRTQGVALDYRNDQFHLVGGYTDGHSATGGFNSPALSRDTEVSLTARAELLLDGDWSTFNSLASFPDDEGGVMLGGAMHYQDGEYGTADDELEVLQWTGDLSVEFGGANLFAYVVGRHLDSTTVDLDQYGFVVQGGYFLDDDWEVFGRYEWGDDDGLTSEDLSAFTVGLNRYFYQNSIKWTSDVGFGLDEITATWGDGFIGSGGDVSGWRTDSAGSDGQLVFRSQLQLAF